ncbi:MAG: hypothetical protein N3E37_01735 [Candidatus Micrarchaeota archaeon]|nr:hypothetical protein [Candidatus Micrarchaeota archaeon]
MDEKVKLVIKNELKKGYRLNKKGLMQLKEAIVTSTNSHKFLSLINLKKWVKEVKKEILKEEKSKQKLSQHSKKGQIIKAKGVIKIKKESLKEEKPEETELVIEPLKSNPAEVYVPVQHVHEHEAVVKSSGTLAQRMTQVQIQNMLFEINSMRQTLANISKKLDSIQAMLEKKD